MLFHYDGRTTEWDEFEWSKRAIHVSVMKQTKWYVIGNINLNWFCMALLKEYLTTLLNVILTTKF